MSCSVRGVRNAPGHRLVYCFRRASATESRGADAPYSIYFGPTGALGSTLTPTVDCAQAATAANQAVRKLAGIRAAVQHARRARRASLEVRAQIKRQAVVQPQATRTTICTRTPLTGPGWN